MYKIRISVGIIQLLKRLEFQKEVKYLFWYKVKYVLGYFVICLDFIYYKFKNVKG